MTGFYSKDFILESAYGQYYISSFIIYFVATIGAMFTTLYSVKVLYLTFISNPNGPLNTYKHVDQGDIFINLPLIILAIFSILFGYFTKDIFIGLATGFYSDNSLFIHPLHESMINTEFGVSTIFKLLPFFFTISLSLISLIFSEFFGNLLINFKFSKLGYNIFSFLNQRFLIELFYNKYITDTVLKLGGQTTKVLDKGSVEWIGPTGLEFNLINLSNRLNSLNTGIITAYALYMLIGFISYLTFTFFLAPHYSHLVILILAIFFSNSKDKSI